MRYLESHIVGFLISILSRLNRKAFFLPQSLRTSVIVPSLLHFASINFDLYNELIARDKACWFIFPHSFGMSFKILKYCLGEWVNPRARPAAKRSRTFFWTVPM